MKKISGKGIYFYPWHGVKYDKGLNGVRVMILGESHYVREIDKNKNYRPFTINVMKGHLTKKDERHSLFSKIIKLFPEINNVKNKSYEAAFYDSVVFYNYVQEIVSNKARDKPTPEMWNKSIVGFETVIAKCQPDFLLILGKRLDKKLEDIPKWKHIGKLKAMDYYIYEGKKNTVAMAINHPSGYGFNYNKLRPLIAEGLKRAKEMKK